MKKAFVYSIAIEGENFTDRIEESQRLKLCFENEQGLSSYQMNFLKALAAGETGDFTSVSVLKKN